MSSVDPSISRDACVAGVLRNVCVTDIVSLLCKRCFNLCVMTHAYFAEKGYVCQSCLLDR